jgi:hypothetical protein
MRMKVKVLTLNRMVAPALNRIKLPVTPAPLLATLALNVLESYAVDVDDTVTMLLVVVDDEMRERPSTYPTSETHRK